MTATLRELGLLDWPTLRAGWAAGWADRGDVVDAAVRRLVDEPGEDDPAVVALAGADHADGEEIGALLDDLAARAEPVDDAVVARRWWLAHLLELERAGLDPDALVDRAEQTWADLGYPDELRSLSRYDDGPTSHLGPPDPHRAFFELVARLRAELTPAG